MNKEASFQQLHYRPSQMEMTGIEDSYEAFDAFFSSFSREECRGRQWKLYQRRVMSYHSERTGSSSF